MKLLLILTTILTFNVYAKCELDLKVKKPNSKTFYLVTGERLSTRIVNKLKAVCTINKTVMSSELVTRLKIVSLQKKLKIAKQRAGN